MSRTEAHSCPSKRTSLGGRFGGQVQVGSSPGGIRGDSQYSATASAIQIRHVRSPRSTAGNVSGRMLAPTDPLYEVESLSSGVTVMPVQRNGDIGVYSNESTDLVKELRAAGVDASFLDPAEHREWRILMSADVVQAFVIAFLAGIASTAAWVAVGALLRDVSGTGRLPFESSSSSPPRKAFAPNGSRRTAMVRP
jgi:hypothetical protein